MKRRINIEFIIDDESPVTFQSTGVLNSKTSPDNFLVEIYADGAPQVSDKYDAITGLAHEFGHVIGQIFKTKAAQEDPRNYYGVNRAKSFFEAMFYGKEMLACETDAWDLAEIMISMDKNRKFYLKEYESGT